MKVISWLLGSTRRCVHLNTGRSSIPREYSPIDDQPEHRTPLTVLEMQNGNLWKTRIQCMSQQSTQLVGDYIFPVVNMKKNLIEY